VFKHNEDGTVVPDDDVVTPYQLNFEPTAEFMTMFSEVEEM